MIVAETARLTLRRLTPADAEFYQRQVNEPSWIENIGDRNIHNTADAAKYITTVSQLAYDKLGFGMYRVALKATDEPVGLCGLLKRDVLPDPDIGFALLESQWGHGYALEAAQAVLNHARQLHMPRLLAVTTQSNVRSGRLLVKLGFAPVGTTRLTPQGEELRLYAAAIRHP